MKMLLAVFMLGTATLLQCQTQTITPLRLSTSSEKIVNAVEFSTKPYRWVSVSGHWVALDKNNPVAGFSFSDLSCRKAGLEGPDDKGGCDESTANIIPNVGFQVSADHNEYELVSWRDDGMTARYVGGACRIAHTVEIDFKTGGVVITDAPTAATLSKPFCKNYAASASYELMNGEAFVVGTAKETR